MDGTSSQTTLTIFGAEKVDTQQFFSEDDSKTFLVEFQCVDEAGNAAQPLFRQVEVVNPCIAPSKPCPGSGICSVAGVCPVCVGRDCLEWPALPLEEPQRQADAFVSEDIAVRDIDPPTVRLLGSGAVGITGAGIPVMSHTLTVGEEWEEPGLEAYDRVDGDVLSMVEVEGIVQTKFPTPLQQPYVITYTATDNAGNAASAQRWVFVACTAGSAVCPADDFWPGSMPSCGAGGVCGLNPALLIGGQNLESLAKENGALRLAMSKIDPADEPGLPPPVISLVGPGVVDIPQRSPYRACDIDTPPRVVCDRGATANDTLVGDVTPWVLACHSPGGTERLFSADGVAPCGIDTSVPGNITVTFTIVVRRNANGDPSPVRSASVSRVIRVNPACPAGEFVCPGNSECSRDTICEGDLLDTGILQRWGDGLSENGTSRGMQLELVGPELVDVKRGSEYAPCEPGKLHSDESPCDGGARAAGADGSDVSSAVFALPGRLVPSTCLDQSCTGLEFSSKGLLGCGIDTSAIEGTMFVVQFVLVDIERKAVVVRNRTDHHRGSLPRRRAALVRRRDLLPCRLRLPGRPCPARPLPGAAPPALELLGPALLVIRYGEQLEAGPLHPPVRHSTPKRSCRSAAPGPSAAPAPTSAAPSSCGRSSPAEQISRRSAGAADVVGSGPPFCLPGRYVYRYQVTDAAGRTSAAEREVVIEEVGKVEVVSATGRKLPDQSAGAPDAPTLWQ